MARSRRIIQKEFRMYHVRNSGKLFPALQVKDIYDKYMKDGKFCWEQFSPEYLAIVHIPPPQQQSEYRFIHRTGHKDISLLASDWVVLDEGTVPSFNVMKLKDGLYCFENESFREKFEPTTNTPAFTGPSDSIVEYLIGSVNFLDRSASALRNFLTSKTFPSNTNENLVCLSKEDLEKALSVLDNMVTYADLTRTFYESKKNKFEIRTAS